VPRLTVDIIHFQRQFAAAHILILQLQAVDGVVQLAVNAFTVWVSVELPSSAMPSSSASSLPSTPMASLSRDSLLADTLVEAGHSVAPSVFRLTKVS
jgi:hypothetical protein